MKVKSLVIVDQHATVNMYSSFVHTARHALEIDQIENEIKEGMNLILLAWGW
jgi:hypothetical protein